MGLAASQARLLGLTARKTNVEYQGQQVNQTRTALANEMAGLYNEYAKLDVPTPPSSTDYTKTVYTMDSTYEEYTISNLTKITSGEYAGYYNTTLTCEESVAKAYTYTAKNADITAEKDESGNYDYLKFVLGTDVYEYKEGDEKNSTITKIDKDYDQYPGLKTIMDANGVSEEDNPVYYSYSKNGTTYYTSKQDLDDTVFQSVDEQLKYYGDYTFDYQGSVKTSKSIQAIASITQDSSGRLQTIQVIECPDDKDLEGHAYSVTTTQKEDQQGYQDAMNEYEYEKQVYEKQVQDINAKTEAIQQQDRSLELQLKQLDTEEKALTTEMDSIKTVLKDTIDSVFKTFEG